VTDTVFVQTLQRALRYRVVHIRSLHQIAWFCASQGKERLPEADVDESFCRRKAYLDGWLTDEPDLSIYDEDLDEDYNSTEIEGIDDETNQQESEEEDG
jgi:hypothetical protein